MKKAITITLILISLDISALFYIKANSSDFTIGTTLSQTLKKDSKWHSVAFLSKSLSLMNKTMKYITRKYVTLVKIEIDYKNFKYFITTRKLN